ncbi:hypothetical protein [Proteus mirabilis]|nr:hypothetical protein [Proteus mirabilis]EKW4027325.1 hypothetical protein [Proteus mirabilis]ELA8074571.1 hypothetical protein [Proteus mirabilis]ELJ9404303.1 hypothetical protein [Proteus mirabilis]ELJ9438669.1 hypothetical protein [Proteus mirabilis]ELS1789374.1 hypothetical protein [Proteus mirabilis]
MPTIILIGDSDTGHDHHGPTNVITGSSTVNLLLEQKLPLVDNVGMK